VSKHIGIVAVSGEGAALCYRQLSRHAARLPEQPTITIHNEPLGRYISAVRAQDWHTIGSLLRRSAEKLAGVGAEFCLCPDNAVQHGLHLAEVGSPIPWLAMPELVAERVGTDGRRVVGVLGTTLVTEGSTYQTHLGLHGIKVLGLTPEDARRVDEIIFGELIYGHLEAESRRAVVGVIERLADRGAEGVVLALSEGSLMVSAEDSPLPLYDSSEILAAGAITYATG